MQKGFATVFDSIPEAFRRHEKIYVMQYEFSGIQSFIFGDITSASTRESIGRRSGYIIRATSEAETFLRKRFSRFDAFRVLSKSSGKLICAVSRRTRLPKVIAASDELQRIVYASTGGRTELFYGVCESVVVSEEESGDMPNAMAELAKRVNRNKYHCTNTLGAVGEAFIRPEFVPREDGEAAQGRGIDGIMAAVKLDLDNLGSFFQKITAFDTRKAASECLARVLNDAMAAVPGVDPVFVGGDDVFFVTPFETYIETIAALYQEIRRGIGTHEELALYRDAFGISGGVSLIRQNLGTVPLVYFFEESEEELLRAKRVSGKNVIVMPKRCVLSWEQLNMLASILSDRREQIFKGQNDEQRQNVYADVGLLLQQIRRMEKERRLRLSPEEKTICQ